MKTIFFVCSLFAICGLVPISSVYAHDVHYPVTSFVDIEDETFDRHSLQTGEYLTINGKITSNVEKAIQGWMSIFSESYDTGNLWEIVAREPPETVFDVKGGSFVDYSITVKALAPGTYHIHSQFNIDKIGPHHGPGQTIVVQGEPINKPLAFTNIAYGLILLGIGCVVAIGIVYYFWRTRK